MGTRDVAGVRSADLNGDGGLDFASANSQAVFVFLNTPAVTLSSSRVSFASQLVGVVSGPKIVLFNNPSGTPLKFSDITTAGENATDFAQTNTCDTKVPPGTSCTISVTFGPAATGIRSASLIIHDNALTREQTVSLSGVGAVPTITAVVGGASFTLGIAAGSLATIFGTTLADSPASAMSVPLPTTLANTTVMISGEAAPLLYAGPNQINLQIPDDLIPGAATAVVNHSTVSSQLFPIQLAQAAPGIFLVPGGNHAVAQNADFSTNSDANPTPAGEPIILYLTGAGAVNPPVQTGEAAASMPPSLVAGNVQVSIGGVPAFVTFAGLAPGFVGLVQVNAVIPPGLFPGDYAAVISIDGIPSNTAYISVASSKH